jgi:hypothetical protein
MNEPSLTDATVPTTADRGPDLVRRRLLTAAAWSIPVVALATASPAAASSEPPLGAIVLGSRLWDFDMNYGYLEATFSPVPATAPTLDTGYLTFDDGTMSCLGYTYITAGETFSFYFESSGTAPETFTATLSIPGYAPVAIPFAAG